MKFTIAESTGGSVKSITLLYACAWLICVGFLGCGPKCLEGHDEKVWIAESCSPIFNTITTGHDTVISVYIGDDCKPGYWGTLWVCDKYELEKE